MKWSLYLSSNQQNLTIGSIRLKSDYWVVKISLTTGLGSYPGLGAPQKCLLNCIPEAASSKSMEEKLMDAAG